MVHENWWEMVADLKEYAVKCGTTSNLDAALKALDRKLREGEDSAITEVAYRYLLPEEDRNLVWDETCEFVFNYFRRVSQITGYAITDELISEVDRRVQMGGAIIRSEGFLRTLDNLVWQYLAIREED